ncbi:exodeoxyribonuclease V subunit gamma [Martelella alba]|uniref:RecBCD enzyme subunit RecC n=1 Tax=Martelella alba TaxID=2590451 RepID=A0ABY2SNB2_9HYPH|nr:exodeoxyribonuclease V subunit gamma [Martelella alba]TKI05928.1 exodeoxyribonuclease V subunit gamma [Martelella alba]
MFRIYHSNRLDLLKELAAALIEREPLADPFQPEVILVQSTGMAQWLQIELATHFGIAANIEFPLPASFIWQMFGRVLPDVPAESAFSKDAMTWKLMSLLPALSRQPGFEVVCRYLSDDDDLRKCHQFAARLADLFDQYLVFRPDWLESWQKGDTVAGLGEAQLWQAPLWRALVEFTAQSGQSPWHRANLYQRFIHTLEAAKSRPAGLPQRVFICGISALPPTYLQALQALGRHVDIHLLFTNPCRYYWGDIRDHAFLAKLQLRTRSDYRQPLEKPVFRRPEQAGSLFDDQGELAVGNPLLASWGKLGRDHLYLLSQLEDGQEVDAFVDPDGEGLLPTLQRDILDLEDHAVLGMRADMLENSGAKRRLDPDDRSLSLHACHSPQREVETLHDWLLAAMNDDPELSPRDIIVMVADIDQYAPAIQAVFGDIGNQRHLPFALSDRRARQLHPVLPAFIRLLDLPRSRFAAEHILSLLEVPALAARFSIREDDRKLLRQWVDESGIRWGLDDDNIRDLMLPATGQHTWQFGLTRMLLGYAMDSRSGDWDGILPYDESSGLIAELAGNLAELLAQLRRWRNTLSLPKTPADWLPCCRAMIEDFFLPDAEAEMALTLLEDQWRQLMRFGIQAGVNQPIGVTLFCDELAARLDQQRVSQRFLAGAINFCTLMPMRSIPFKIVCLLGMNDGVYPRVLPPMGFDLMTQQPRRGDRSRRDDDRYLFLEALLSARQRFYISYIGRSIQDNAARYPSVLVSELADYIAQSFCLPGDESLDVDASAEHVRRHLVQGHPRMPFAPENFIPGSEQQSFAAEWLPSASGGGTPHREFGRPLAERPFNALSFEDLRAFYRHSVRAFFQQRLGVNFRLEERELVAEEPFVIDGLTRYRLDEQLLTALIDGEDPNRLYRKVKAAGNLPYGAFGELFWEKQCDGLAELADKVREHRRREDGKSIEVSLDLDGLTLSGWLTQVQNDGLLRWRPGVLSVGDGMSLWLEHLVWCAMGGAGESRMFGIQGEWRFAALAADEARIFLVALAQGYRQGMQTPLLLLSRSGGAWLNQCFDRDRGEIDWSEGRQQQARDKLLQAWLGDDHVPGDGEDAYIQRVVRQLGEAHLAAIIRAAQTYYLPPFSLNLAVTAAKSTRPRPAP